MLSGFTPWPEQDAERYRLLGCWEGETFGEMLKRLAAFYEDKIAISYGNEQVSYKQLDIEVNRLASGFLNLGVKREDRIIVQLGNSIDFFRVIFALFRIGALPVFALPQHRTSEIVHISQQTEAIAYIIPDKRSGFDYSTLAKDVTALVPSLHLVIVAGEPDEFYRLEDLYLSTVSLPEILSSDVAFLQLSGGSTGLPKLIPRTHDDYIYSLKASVEVCALNCNSVYLVVLPVAHNFTMSSPGVLGTLYAGGRVVLSPTQNPGDAFSLIEQERVTITALVPPLALIWLDTVANYRYDLSSLKVLQVGGAKFSMEAAKRIQTVFECRLQQVFGMAEGLVNYTRLDDPEEIIVGTQGRPMSIYDEIRIVDDEDQEVEIGQPGHLLTRGPYTIRGYYKAEEYNQRAFTSDGFYRTGDIVFLDPFGNLVVEGREKDQINKGGEKFSAEEIENHLLAHPNIHDAAIVSIPDEYLGERSCAYVITRGVPLKASELKVFIKSRGVAAYKIPDKFEFVESFPKTNVGKVNKKKLRIMAEELGLGCSDK